MAIGRAAVPTMALRGVFPAWYRDGSEGTISHVPISTRDMLDSTEVGIYDWYVEPHTSGCGAIGSGRSMVCVLGRTAGSGAVPSPRTWRYARNVAA